MKTIQPPECKYPVEERSPLTYPLKLQPVIVIDPKSDLFDIGDIVISESYGEGKLTELGPSKAKVSGKWIKYDQLTHQEKSKKPSFSAHEEIIQYLMKNLGLYTPKRDHIRRIRWVAMKLPFTWQLRSEGFIDLNRRCVRYSSTDKVKEWCDLIVSRIQTIESQPVYKSFPSPITLYSPRNIPM